MKHASRMVGIVMVVVLAAVVGQVGAGKKVKEYKGQATHKFVNEAGEPAYGLEISLSAAGIVVTGDDNRAGPFGNMSGNDTSTLRLTNPTEPVAAAGSFELTFRSYNSKLKINSWQWLNEKGKKIGQKHKL